MRTSLGATRCLHIRIIDCSSCIYISLAKLSSMEVKVALAVVLLINLSTTLAKAVLGDVSLTSLSTTLAKVVLGDGHDISFQQKLQMPSTARTARFSERQTAPIADTLQIVLTNKMILIFSLQRAVPTYILYCKVFISFSANSRTSLKVYIFILTAYFFLANSILLW